MSIKTLKSMWEMGDDFFPTYNKLQWEIAYRKGYRQPRYQLPAIPVEVDWLWVGTIGVFWFRVYQIVDDVHIDALVAALYDGQVHVLEENND